MNSADEKPDQLRASDVGLGHNGGPAFEDISAASLETPRLWTLKPPVIEPIEGLTEQQIRRGFTPLVNRICDLIGFELTVKLFEDCGGQSIYLARKPTADSNVTHSIGLAAAQILGEEYPGMKLDLSSGPFSGVALRRLHGLSMLKRGASINQVCHKLRIARSTVIEWKRLLRD